MSELPEVLEQNGRAPGGVHYYLPRTVLDLTLSVDPQAATYRVTASNSRAIADSRHRYYLRYRPLPQYEDKITISVGSSGFLKQVVADTTDRTPDAIIELARAVGAFGAGFEAATVQANEAQLVKLTVDPTDDTDLANATAKFNEAASRYAKAAAGSVCPPKPEKPEDPPKVLLQVVKQAQCKEYTAIHDAIANEKKEFIAVRSQPLAGSYDETGHHHRNRQTQAAKRGERSGHPTARHAAEPLPPARRADCSVGICYRPPIPVEMMIKVGRNAQRDIIMSPNKADLVEIDIHRAFFVNKVQTIDFDETDGTLKSIATKKGSELLALSNLPVQVLSAVADGLTIRVKLIQDKVKDLKAEQELISARNELQKQKLLVESAMRQAPTGVASQSSVPRIVSLPTQSGTALDRTPLQ